MHHLVEVIEEVNCHGMSYKMPLLTVLLHGVKLYGVEFFDDHCLGSSFEGNNLIPKAVRLKRSFLDTEKQHSTEHRYYVLS